LEDFKKEICHLEIIYIDARKCQKNIGIIGGLIN